MITQEMLQRASVVPIHVGGTGIHRLEKSAIFLRDTRLLLPVKPFGISPTDVLIFQMFDHAFLPCGVLFADSDWIEDRLQGPNPEFAQQARWMAADAKKRAIYAIHGMQERTRFDWGDSLRLPDQ